MIALLDRQRYDDRPHKLTRNTTSMQSQIAGFSNGLNMISFRNEYEAGALTKHNVKLN